MAIPTGLAVGLVSWYAGGGPAAASSQIEPVRQAVSRLRPRGATAPNPQLIDAREIAGIPLFPLTVGPGAVAQPMVRLDGVMRAPGRAAALLSVNDKPAEWLRVGDTRDGVTLQEVQGSKVVVDTLFGPQDVILGEKPAPAARENPVPSGPQVALPGSTPPPASVPGIR